jgi:hypothetical protein
MAQIKLNFSRLSVAEKIVLARNIFRSMDAAHATFTNPQPSLPDLDAAVGELADAEIEVQNARQAARMRTALRNQKEDVVDALIARLVGYVTAIAAGDDAIITSAGMGVRAEAGSGTTPSIPDSLSATAGDQDGEMDLSWDPVTTATSYTVESSLDPAAASWQHAGVSTKSSFTVTGLQPGSRRWFRVAAVNPAVKAAGAIPPPRSCRNRLSLSLWERVRERCAA